jgi:hypothetical protein
MSLRPLWVFILITASLSVGVARQKSGGDSAFSQIDSIVKTLSDISGLPEKHPVPYGRMTKMQLRRFLTKRIKRTLRPEEIRADEMALKMFGLVPQEFDLKKSTIDLLTEQAAAFYDYDEKKLFLLQDSSATAEVTTLAHELSHALADQHFDLEKYMEQNSVSDDENLARTAVVEGQASWLMIAYDLKAAGQPPVPTPDMLKTVVDSSQGSITDYPVLKSSPLYIQQSLLFPYTEGTLFFNAVFKKEGKDAFTGVFASPPSDSAQIIHPDRYFARTKATEPQLPNVDSDGKDTEVSEGSVGEFDHEILLWQYLNEAQARTLAAHLRGGHFKIVATGKERKPLLTYASEWDSHEHAADFFGAYQKVLRAKWKHLIVSASTETVLAGEGDNGYFITRLAGSTVSSIEGVSDQDGWDRLKRTSKIGVALKLPFALRTEAREGSAAARSFTAIK